MLYQLNYRNVSERNGETTEPSAKKSKTSKTCQHCHHAININACQKCTNCGKKQNKCCQKCGVPMTSNASKECHQCGHKQISKKAQKKKESKPKGYSVDQTAQRDIVRKRLECLHENANNHCIVMYLSGVQRIHVDTYATPGFADHFMNGLKIEGLLFGNVIKDTFKTAYQEYLRSNPGSSVQAPTPAPDESQTEHSTGEPVTSNLNLELEQQHSSAGERNPIDRESTISEPATGITDPLLEPTQNVCLSVPAQPNSTESDLTTSEPAISHPDSYLQSLPTAQKQYIVEGIWELTKNHVREGMIVPLYAAAAHEDNFWLFMLTSVSPRKIEGKYLEKVEERSTLYKIGSAEKLLWKNIIHTKKRPVSFYVMEMLREGHFYRLPQTAIPMLNALTT